MISQVSEVVRVECDDDQCFESAMVTVGPDDSLYDALTFTHNWTVLFDVLDNDKVSCYCTRHEIVEGVQ